MGHDSEPRLEVPVEIGEGEHHVGEPAPEAPVLTVLFAWPEGTEVRPGAPSEATILLEAVGPERGGVPLDRAVKAIQGRSQLTLEEPPRECDRLRVSFETGGEVHRLEPLHRRTKHAAGVVHLLDSSLQAGERVLSQFERVAGAAGLQHALHGVDGGVESLVVVARPAPVDVGRRHDGCLDRGTERSRRGRCPRRAGRDTQTKLLPERVVPVHAADEDVDQLLLPECEQRVAQGHGGRRLSRIQRRFRRCAFFRSFRSLFFWLLSALDPLDDRREPSSRPR